LAQEVVMPIDTTGAFDLLLADHVDVAQEKCPFFSGGIFGAGGKLEPLDGEVVDGLLLALAEFALEHLALFARVRVAEFFDVGGRGFLKVGDEAGLWEKVGLGREKPVEAGLQSFAHQPRDFGWLRGPADSAEEVAGGIFVPLGCGQGLPGVLRGKIELHGVGRGGSKTNGSAMRLRRRYGNRTFSPRVRFLAGRNSAKSEP
jgi:hypothetical protein